MQSFDDVLGFIEMLLEVASVIEFLWEFVPVDVGLVYVFGLQHRLYWGNLLLRRLEPTFHHYLAIGLLRHVLPGPVSTVLAP